MRTRKIANGPSTTFVGVTVRQKSETDDRLVYMRVRVHVSARQTRIRTSTTQPFSGSLRDSTCRVVELEGASGRLRRPLARARRQVLARCRRTMSTNLARSSATRRTSNNQLELFQWLSQARRWDRNVRTQGDREAFLSFLFVNN